MSDPTSRPVWAEKLWASLGLNAGDGPGLVFERADSVANLLAPNTRRMWNLIILFQGMAVLAPLFWLLVVRERWDVSFTAYTVVLTTLLVVALCWWVRWRGMQHTWTRTRMVAEIARSTQKAGRVYPHATLRALSGPPPLQAVAEKILSGAPAPAGELATRAAAYREDRIEDQLAYYRNKREEAVDKRHSLSRIVTVSLDGALFLAAAGLVISFRREAVQWLNWSSSDYVLGFLGAGLPLIAILAQMRGAYLELNRRVGRYAQQIEFLQTARDRADACRTEGELEDLVTEVERSLMGEVVEWYYQAEHSEPYYRSKRGKDLDERDLKDVSTGRRGLLPRVWTGIEYSAGFLGRVLFGRVLVVALSIVFTTALIHYKRAPDDPLIHSTLRLDDGKLLSPNPGGPYQPWDPLPEFTENGFILIAHGLRDGVDFDNTGSHWMSRMERQLRQRFRRQPPDICLVDWHVAAKPSDDLIGTLDTQPLDVLGMPPEASAMMNDLTMIRAQGERIGELVGFKLARSIRAGEIRKDQPMHLIGHSAGGFVVTHVALALIDLGLAPENLHVTLLDTPLPRASDLEQVASRFPVDYYATSQFAQGVPPDAFAPNFRRFTLQPPEGIDPYTGAHSYAYQWFLATIEADGDGIGFGRSPFAAKE